MKHKTIAVFDPDGICTAVVRTSDDTATFALENLPGTVMEIKDIDIAKAIVAGEFELKGKIPKEMDSKKKKLRRAQGQSAITDFTQRGLYNKIGGESFESPEEEHHH